MAGQLLGVGSEAKMRIIYIYIKGGDAILTADNTIQAVKFDYLLI